MKKSHVKIKDLGNISEGSGSIYSNIKKPNESRWPYSNLEMSIDSFSSTSVGTSAILEPIPFWFGIIERISYQQIMGGIWVPHFVVRAENNEKFWIPIFGQFSFQISAMHRCARCHQIISTSGNNYGDLIFLPGSGTKNRCSNEESGNIRNDNGRRVLHIKNPPKQFFCKNCEEIVNLTQKFRMRIPSCFNVGTNDNNGGYNDDKNENEIKIKENIDYYDNNVKNTSNSDEDEISNGQNNEQINIHQFCNYVLKGKERKVKIEGSKGVMKKQQIKCMDCVNLEKCFKSYVIVLMISKYCKKKGIEGLHEIKEIDCYLTLIEPEKIEFVAQSWGISCVIAFFPTNIMSSKLFCTDNAQNFVENIIKESYKSNKKGEKREFGYCEEKTDFNKKILHLVRSLLWNNDGLPIKIRIEDSLKISFSIGIEKQNLFSTNNRNGNLTKRFQNQIQFFKDRSKIKQIRSSLSSDLKIIEEKIMQMMSEPKSEKSGAQGSWEGFHYFPNSFQVHYASKILLNTVSNDKLQNEKANSDILIHESMQVLDFLDKNFDNEYESLFINGKILGFHGFYALIQDFYIQNINFNQFQAYEGEFLFSHGKKEEKLKKLVILDLQGLVGHQIGLISNY